MRGMKLVRLFSFNVDVAAPVDIGVDWEVSNRGEHHPGALDGEGLNGTICNMGVDWTLVDGLSCSGESWSDQGRPGFRMAKAAFRAAFAISGALFLFGQQ